MSFTHLFKKFKVGYNQNLSGYIKTNKHSLQVLDKYLNLLTCSFLGGMYC